MVGARRTFTVNPGRFTPDFCRADDDSATEAVSVAGPGGRPPPDGARTGSELDLGAHVPRTGTRQDKSGSCRVLHRDADRFVQRQLRIVGPSRPVAGDQLTDLGVDMVSGDRAGA